jgi:rhamnogalacturonyl hydrolase YesR
MSPLNSQVLELMKRVADWQIPGMGPDKDWVHAAGWVGVMAAYESTLEPRYLRAIKAWAGDFGLTETPRHPRADNQCAAQVFLDVYRLDPTRDNAFMLAAAKAAFDVLADNPPAGRVEWWWQDALFMAPPGLARLGAITGDPRYVRVMHEMWWDTHAFLFEPRVGLMYRDDRRREDFWARGNGWVVAGIARVLPVLPVDDPRRGAYVELLRTMCAALVPLQAADGLWRANLLKPNEIPNPEASGSGFFTYAMAWGVNNGLLDGASYLPVIAKAWRGLGALVRADGHLGWVQPVAALPAATTADSTAPFGVGAFLLAGSEVARIADQGFVRAIAS